MEAGERRRAPASKNKKKSGKGAQVRSAAEEARRREVLKETLREKLELERRAHQVVERLLEDSVTEDFLIDCARLITPANYKDVVEERFISKLCGYPLCPNKLSNVPTQQYKISTKSNKVYDITERKCFCCNFCYKASKNYEVQIPISPLWLRKEERPPDIKLMQKGDIGSSGLEVKLADKPVAVEDIENPVLELAKSQGDSSSQSDSSDAEQDFVSSVVTSQRPHARVHWGKVQTCDGVSEEKQIHECDAKDKALRTEMGNDCKTVKPPQVSHNLNNCLSFPDKVKPVERCVEEARELLGSCTLADSSKSQDTPQDTTANAPLTVPDANGKADLNISQVGMSKRGAAGLRSLLKTHGKVKTEAPSVKVSLLEALRRTFIEWRTEETMKFLYGPDYISQPEPAPQSEEEEELDEDDLEELEEIGEKVVQSGRHQARPMAAAPDYEALRKETEVLDIRVQEFYRGVCVLPEEVDGDAKDESRSTEESVKEPLLPLIDSHAQHLIQTRIAVEKLSKSLRDLVGPLSITMSEIIKDINHLVRTFRFTNTNIIHKPPEWALIAVVLLYVLTEVSPSLRESMAKPTSVDYISSLMKPQQLKEQDLQSLVLLFKPEGQASSTHSATP